MLKRFFGWLASLLDYRSKIHVLTLAEYNSDGLFVHQWEIVDNWSAYSTVLNSNNYEVDKNIDVDSFLGELATIPSLIEGEYTLTFDDGRRRISVKVF